MKNYLYKLFNYSCFPSNYLSLKDLVSSYTSTEIAHHNKLNAEAEVRICLFSDIKGICKIKGCHSPQFTLLKNVVLNKTCNLV